MSNTPIGTRRAFTKFIVFHGHGRNTPDYDLDYANGLVPQPIMQTVVRTESWWCQCEGWMSNTTNPGPIDGPGEADRHMGWLESLTPHHNGKPAMWHTIIIKLTPGMSYKKAYNMLKKARERGYFIVKIYAGETTNTEGDAKGPFKDLYYPSIQAAVELGFIVAIHCEKHGDGIDTYYREERSIHEDIAPMIQNDFPQGRFNIEHISRADTIAVVKQLPETVTGGFTPQHLLLSRNEVMEWYDRYYKRKGGNLAHVCRPPIQRIDNMEAIQTIALNADKPENRRFHQTPDSAFHEKTVGKAPLCGCNGVFSAPVLGPVIVDFFDRHDKLDHPAYTAYAFANAAHNYGVEIDYTQIFELEKCGESGWVIPYEYGGAVPIMAGRRIGWKPVEPAALDPHLLAA